MAVQINIPDSNEVSWSAWNRIEVVARMAGCSTTSVRTAAKSGKPYSGRQFQEAAATPDDRKQWPKLRKKYRYEVLADDGEQVDCHAIATIEPASVALVRHTADPADAMLIKPALVLPELSWRRRINAMVRKVARVHGLAGSDSEGHHALRTALYDYWLLRMGTDIRKAAARYTKEQGLKSLPIIEYMERAGKCEALYAVGWELWKSELEGGAK